MRDDARRRAALLPRLSLQRGLKGRDDGIAVLLQRAGLRCAELSPNVLPNVADLQVAYLKLSCSL